MDYHRLSWTIIIDYNGQRELFIESLDYNDQLVTDRQTDIARCSVPIATGNKI